MPCFFNNAMNSSSNDWIPRQQSELEHSRIALSHNGVEQAFMRYCSLKKSASAAEVGPSGHAITETACAVIALSWLVIGGIEKSYRIRD